MTSDMVSELKVLYSSPKNLIVELQLFGLHWCIELTLVESDKCIKDMLSLLPIV